MSWNYRVMRDRNPDGSAWFAIYEVYYDADGNPNGWTENPSRPQGDTFKELTEDATRYQAAFGRPVLAIEAGGSELYDIGGMGNRRTPVLVWKRSDPPAIVPPGAQERNEDLQAALARVTQERDNARQFARDLERAARCGEPLKGGWCHRPRGHDGSHACS
jgi:hypothetical protein